MTCRIGERVAVEFDEFEDESFTGKNIYDGTVLWRQKGWLKVMFDSDASVVGIRAEDDAIVRNWRGREDDLCTVKIEVVRCIRYGDLLM